MWNRPRMLGPRTSSNGRSTDTPPKCRMVPQPSASRRMATPSLRSAAVNVAPGGSASGNGAMSVRRSVMPASPSWRASWRPSAPEAPVSSTGFFGSWSGMAFLACGPAGGVAPSGHADDHGRGRRARSRAGERAGAGGTGAGPHRRSGRRGRARLRAGGRRAGTADGRRDGHAAPRGPRAEPLRRHPREPEGPGGRRGADDGAASRALADAPPATRTAPVVARLMAAGFVPVGRANMSEFAFSGLGLNPHHGTPASPWDRATRRIPGGSSSGAAVSVGDGMVFMGLGTDTGGSCRIPAAFCGVVGYKPTASRVPLTGILPLAFSLDSVGPLARSVACCALTDAVLAGDTPAVPQAAELSGLRLLVPDNIVLD